MTDSINPVAGAAYVPHTVSASSGTGGGLGTAFSDVLAETLQDQVVQNGIAMSAGGKEQLNSVLGGNSVNTTGNLETMILAAAATGEVNDAQIALFMLMTLMSQETDGEFSALFGMMASMLPNIGGGAEELYSSFTLSDFDDVIKSRVDTEVFGGVYGDIDAIAPLQFWKPANPVVTGDGQNRSPERLRAVIDQFQVETAERYLPGRDGYTYCNIFVWDVTAALGAEIPHYYNKATGEPMYYPDTEGSSAMRAAAMDTWLLDHGEEYGWRKV
ncbi:MAG: hypothetical protein LBS90_06730, partial [Oscillospiraceae bacterium]|nr:hypothetical protein [Oscillospiraceae bacterium]